MISDAMTNHQVILCPKIMNDINTPMNGAIAKYALVLVALVKVSAIISRSRAAPLQVSPLI